ncbi:phage tail protein [Enterococcus sp. LJL128]
MFLDKDTPNFIWNNLNAFEDFGLIIEEELSEILPARKYNETVVAGSNRVLHEWFGDYEPYTLTISNVSIPYENLTEVKKWLRGPGKLITHNDSDKYSQAICNMGKEQEFLNEWGVFYTFSIEFRCEPLKRKVREEFLSLRVGQNIIYDLGDEPSKPYIEIESGGGNITISCGETSLFLSDTFEGLLTIDNELGMYVQNNSQQRSKGNWIRLQPGENKLILSGNIKAAKMKVRSVFL